MFWHVFVILYMGEVGGSVEVQRREIGYRRCTLPLDMRPIPYPPPVLQSSGGHQITYCWQSGGMHSTGMLLVRNCKQRFVLVLPYLDPTGPHHSVNVIWTSGRFIQDSILNHLSIKKFVEIMTQKMVCVWLYNQLQSGFSQLGNSGNSAISFKGEGSTNIKMYVERNLKFNYKAT